MGASPLEPVFIKPGVFIPRGEIEINAVRAQGPGGQNVNKVNSAAHLRFDVNGSSLPDYAKAKILMISDTRLTAEGVIVIKAQNHRRLEKNQKEALARLTELIKDALKVKKHRRPTRPTRGSVKRRLETKSKRSKLKQSRGKADYSD